MLSETGSGLSVMELAPAFSPSCQSTCAHTNEPSDVRTDAKTAGLPVSVDLGWIWRAPRGF